jgi:hypothetical protein
MKQHVSFYTDNWFPRTDYFIIAAGAWFKPMYIYTHYNLHYNDSVTLSHTMLNNSIYNIRNYLENYNSNAQFIWRIHPHAGNIDEMKYLQNITTLSHYDGFEWNNRSRSANWVIEYNKLFNSLAEKKGDSVLDLYSLSLLYIDYFNRISNTTTTHADSLHYCAKALPRGSLLVLQDVLYDLHHNVSRI